MSSRQPSTTTTVSRQELPAWVSQAATANIAAADQLASRPYQPYTGQLVAAENILQQQGYQQALAGSGSGAILDEAARYRDLGGITAYGVSRLGPFTASGVGGVGSFNTQAAQSGPAAQVAPQSLAGASLAPYMNPFTSGVIDSSLGAIERARQTQNVNTAGAATGAGAFGGTRQAVLESLTNEAALRQSGELAASFNQANFEQAQRAATFDSDQALRAGLYNAQAFDQNQQFNTSSLNQFGLANQAANLNASQFNANLGQQLNLFNAQAQQQNAAQQLQAAGLLGDFGQNAVQAAGAQSSIFGQELAQRLAAGNQQQDDRQFGLDTAYNQYLRAQQYPVDMLNLRIAALSQTPYAQSQTNTAPSPTRNRLSGAAGGAISGASAGSSIAGPYGAVIGGVLGAAAGYFG